MTTRRHITKRQANTALAQVRRKYRHLLMDGDDLYLNMHWDWPTGGPTPAIIWEGGPYDWALETAFDIHVDGVFAEPYSGWAICLYPD